MKKHFLLLLLLTLLPLAGWATDYEVQVTTFNGTAVWCGGKPAVSRSWFTAVPTSGTLTNDQKDFIASKLKVKDITENPNYDAGSWNYQLELSGSQEVSDGANNYTIYVNSSTTATLTITKNTAEVQFVNGTTPLAYVGGDLAYTGQDQALLTGSMSATIGVGGPSVPVIFTLDPEATTPVTFTDAASVVARNAGLYNVYYKVAGNDNYDGSDWTLLATPGKSIAQATTAAFNVEAVTGLVFNNTDQALLAKTVAEAPIVPFGAEGLQYQIDGGDWTAFTTLDAITGKSAKNAVAYAVKFKIPADASANANWADIESGVINVTIAKATPAFISWPTTANQGLATGLKYNETAQTLALTQAVAKITPAVGDAFEVPVKYELRRSFSDGTSGQTSWSTKSFDNLKGTYAGQYWIRYSVVATDDYNGLTAGNAKSGNTIIAKATIPAESYTAPTAKEGLRTTGAAQELITDGVLSDTKYGEFQYSLTNNGTDWSTETPTGTDAGNYTVYYRIYPPVTSNAQNYDIVSGNVAVTIAAKSKVTITIPANQSFGYGTTPTLEYTATWEAQGSDVLDETGLTWTWYTGATGDTQASKVGGYYPAGEYYVMVGGLAVKESATSASQEIVYPTARQKVKITAGQIVANISSIVTYGSEPTFTLTHVSGLAPADAETLNANSTVKTVTVKKGEEVLVNGDPATDDVKNALKALDAYDSYTLEATAEYDPNTNYTLLVNPGTLKVNPNAAYGFTIGDIADVEYKAAKWEPAVTVAGLTKDKDYTVTYGGTVGTTTYDNIKAGEGVVIINGIGNYAGATSSKTFTINKAALTITANNRIGDDAWVYGTAEFTDEYPKYTAKVTGLKSDNDYVDGKLAGIADALTVVRTSNETVGMHEGALVAQFGTAQPAASDNYTITYNAGNLQIAKGTVVIKLKEAVDDDTYGDDPDATESIKTAIQNIANYEYVSGLSELEAANFASIIDVSAATYTLASDQYQVGTNYSFAIDGVTSTNYKVTVPEGGIYKVNPSPITLKAKDQTIDWSADATATPNTTVSDATVEVITSGSEPGLRYEDALTDVIASVVIESTKVGEEGNVISLTAKQNANYNIIELQNGKLTITGAEIVLMRSVYADANDDEFSTIQSYNGLNKQVKITVNRTYTLPGTSTTYTWKGEDWNAFILPFDITPKELSAAFGYAIVNVVNPAATKDGNIAFKLQMSGTIEANTPFMLKNYQAVEEGAVIDFGVREIVAPESAEVSIPAGEGIQFIGSYKTKKLGENMSNLYFYNGEGAWKHLKAATTTSWNIAPFNAYMEMPATGGAREYTFTFEELDGGTTAIRSISEDATGTNAKGWYTLNGVKMQNAPTQKGVYIKDGKKVVIK